MSRIDTGAAASATKSQVGEAAAAAYDVDQEEKTANSGDSIDVAVVYVLVATDRNMSREDIVADWRLQLPEEEIFPVGGEKIAVSSSAERASKVVEWLAAQPRVRWVDRKPKWVLHNRYASKAIQSSDGLSTGMWSRGLQGDGQIVGIADTGIDIDSCFFRDADHSVSLCPTNGDGEMLASSQAGCKNGEHRKVVMYRYVPATNPSVHGYDAEFGHGTHVAGSVGGSASAMVTTAARYTYASEYDGAAPNAKLTFDDISSDGDALDGIPGDLNTGLFPPSYWAGARVHSNSWGDSRAWCVLESSTQTHHVCD